MAVELISTGPSIVLQYQSVCFVQRKKASDNTSILLSASSQLHSRESFSILQQIATNLPRSTSERASMNIEQG